MTIPRERTQALYNTITFLQALLDPKQTPGVPRWVRREAYWCLRHYPHSFEIDKLSKAAPDLFEKVHRPRDFKYTPEYIELLKKEVKR